MATMIEAAIVGLLAAIPGVAVGALLATGLEAVFKVVGASLPSYGLVFKPRTALVGLVVGVGVSLLASFNPARRAAFLGVATLAPIGARPAVSVIGSPLRRLSGVAGVLARQNAMRNPRRTAATASALMIGLALVTMFSVLGPSAKANALYRSRNVGVTAVDGATVGQTLIVGGTYASSQLIGTNYLVATNVFEANFTDQLDQVVMVRVAGGADPAVVRAGLDRAIAGYPNVSVEDPATGSPPPEAWSRSP